MLSEALDKLLACPHRHTTFPITPKKGLGAIQQTYVSCLDCGKELAYDSLETLGELLVADLDGDGPAQPRVARFPHFTHAARPDVRDDFVGPQTGSSGYDAHFFSPAVQFSTTVIGLGAISPLWVLTRKRCPSRAAT